MVIGTLAAIPVSIVALRSAPDRGLALAALAIAALDVLLLAAAFFVSL